MLFHNYALDRVAVVDAFSTGHLLGPAFRSRGVGVVHVRNDETHAYGQRATYHSADFESELSHTAARHAQVLESLRELRVQHVIAGIESGSTVADQLGRDLGCATANAGCISARRDKRVMHRVVSEAGVRVPWQQHVADDGTVTWQTPGSRPRRTIVKPPMSAGSDSVIDCRSPDDEARAVQSVISRNDIYMNRNAGAVVQERLDGPEYVVNTVSVDGVHACTEVWRSDKSVVDGNIVYDRQVLMDPAEAVAVQLFEYVSSVLTALGVRWGAGHTELIQTAKGPLLLESAARLPGGVDPSLALAALGRSQIDEVVEAYLNPDLVRERGRFRPPRKAAMGVSLVSSVEGRVRWPVDLTEILALPSFHSAKITARPGDMLLRTRDLLSKPGGIYLCHEDPAQLDADYEEIRRWEEPALAAAVR